MIKKRKEQESPLAVEEWGWKYHHLGVPTTKSFPGERYIPHLKIYVSGFETSPFGIEWMRFEDNSPVSELVRTVPHIAFEVDDLEKTLEQGSFKILSDPQSPSEGVRAAMIEHNGAPVELLEFEKTGKNKE